MDFKILITRSLTGLLLILSFVILFLYFEKYIWIAFSFIYAVIIYEIYTYFIKNRFKIFIYLYVFVSFLLLQLYLNNYYELSELITLFLVIIFFDTFSYVIGSLFGKKKIFKTISPNKSYVGLFGGTFFTIFMLYLLDIYLNYFSLNQSFLIIIIFIILSFVGDIIESFFKRISMIKNSSEFLPGHGGFFDRFDSFIFSVYGLFFYNLVLSYLNL